MSPPPSPLLILNIPAASEVEAVLQDEQATSLLSQTSPEFWIMVAALRSFVEKEGGGHLPLDGSLPDMHATTQRYLDLQRTYREKAEADAAAVQRHVAAILETLGRDSSSIPSADLKRFCKHARHLRVVRTRPLAAPCNGDGKDAKHAAALRGALQSEEGAADATLAILLRAVDRYFAQYGRFPGQHDADVEEDVAVLKGLASTVLLEEGVTGAALVDDLVAEMVRCGAGELQVVAAVVGAITAQEAIKLVTEQYVPLAGTLIYNALHCTTSVLP
jgi:NEDD8-activating enzyme E1 regulatory subunit